MSGNAEPRAHKYNRLRSRVFLAAIILFVVFVRVRLLDFPLERDEGEYAYMGQLILQGVPPYIGAYNMKFPGTYAIYALIMAMFGQGIQGIHLGLVLANCASILLVYRLAGKYVEDSAALAAGASYALLSLSPTMFGFAAHATHFVVLPALGGVLTLLLALRNNKLHTYFLSGVLLGLALLMKQPGLFFLLFGFVYIVYDHFSSWSQGSVKKLMSNLGAFIAGAVSPLLITVVYLKAVGAFDKFWFWTVEYATKYASQVPLSAAFDIFSAKMAHVAGGYPFLWIMSAAGFICVFFRACLKGRRVFVVLFTVFSFLTICPGFYFRPHYFITLLPAVSILIGIFTEKVSHTAVGRFRTPYAKHAGIAIFLLAAGAGMAGQAGYLFKDESVRLSRAFYGMNNPFPESIEIAKFIKAESLPTDRVAVFGSEPQIYFYSGRRSATGHIYVYGLMEKHDYNLAMQQEMIREVILSDPKFIVVVSAPTSWMIRPDSEKYILVWLDDYVRDNYMLVGVADIISPETTVYRWHRDAQAYAVRSPYHVLIFEKARKSL